MRIIVLAKQVPDTRQVGKDAMKEDGTINRAALPAIFNPEDLNALEQALLLKDLHPDTEIILLTMGPPRASEIIREAMYRGADRGYLLTDRAFSGADTLATSYALSMAIKHLGAYDLILCGRQAIDGDTAQVGPQVAEKLGIPQVTYAEEILDITDGKARIKRRLPMGLETVECALPMLITVNGTAAPCRPRNARWVQKYKYARTEMEAMDDETWKDLCKQRPYLRLSLLNVADVQADPAQCGLSGSPTKVKKIENIVFQAKECKHFTAEDNDIESLMIELITNHTIG